VALVRIEQLYPFPEEALTQVLHAYKDVKSFIWCQEEPENQGAWLTMKSRIEACLPQGNTLTYAGRAAAAAPAVGYHNRHLEEQAKLVSEAFNI
jgi:2-oxoglutarate dehydrogenase E1 component